MSTHYPPAEIPWPELPDEAAVALQTTLQDFVMRFESHYFAQIHRYYDDHSRDNLIQPDLFRPTDHEPF
jgi:hypothetical protein